jgi:hypothetical protein
LLGHSAFGSKESRSDRYDFLYCVEGDFIVLVVLIPAFFFVAKTFFPHHPGNWKYPSGLAALM